MTKSNPFFSNRKIINHIKTFSMHLYKERCYEEDNYDTTRHKEGYVNNREYPLIALPRNTTVTQQENILWWAKSFNELHSWINPKNDSEYRIFELVIKPQYIKNLKNELHQLNGLFVKEQQEN